MRRGKIMKARRGLSISFFLFVFSVLSNTGYSQDDVIRVETNLITIPIAVLDRSSTFFVPFMKQE